MIRLLAKFVLALLLMQMVSFAATRTSSQAGNWSSSSTWGGSAAPVAGDRAIILHSVTVDATTTVGESLNALISGTGTVGTGGVSSTTLTGSGTAFLTQARVGDYIKIGSNERIVTAVASDTSLTMDTAATITNGTAFTYTPSAVFLSGTSARLVANENLTVKGGLMTNYPSFSAVDIVTVADQKGIEFDASGSPGTTATKYPIGFMAVAGNQFCTWKFNGTACSIASGATDGSFLRSNAGGGNAYITHMGNVVGGWLDASYTRFTRIGDASTNAMNYWLGNQGASKLILDRCVVDACGNFESFGQPHASSTLLIRGTRFTNSPGTYSLTIPGNNSNATNNVVQKAADGTFCYFSKTFRIGGPTNLSISGSIFAVAPLTGGTGVWKTWDDCWVRQATDSWVLSGSLTNSVLYYDLPAGSNPHFISTGNSFSPTTDFAISDNAFYFNGTDANGNAITQGTPGSTAVNMLIERNFFLPNSAGKASGASFTSSGNVSANFKLQFRHNTAWVDGQHGLEISHLQSIVESPNRYGSIESNLFIGGADSLRLIAYNVDVTSLEDVVPPSVIKKNARYLIQPTNVPNAATFTNQGNGYASKFSATPGTTDIDLDASGGPKFVGAPTGIPATSFLSMWSTSLGGAGTDNDAWANVAAGTAGYTPAAFLAYLAEQCAVQNSVLKDAGEDGVTIGAADYQAARGGAPAGFLIPLGITNLDYSKLPRVLRPIATSFCLAP